MVFMKLISKDMCINLFLSLSPRGMQITKNWYFLCVSFDTRGK